MASLSSLPNDILRCISTYSETDLSEVSAKFFLGFEEEARTALKTLPPDRCKFVAGAAVVDDISKRDLTLLTKSILMSGEESLDDALLSVETDLSLISFHDRLPWEAQHALLAPRKGLRTISKIAQVIRKAFQDEDIPLDMVSLDLRAGRLPELSPELSPEISKFQNLRHLYLSGNSMTHFPDLTVLSSLETLDLMGNNIKEITCAKPAPSLLVLNLQSNQITRITDLMIFPNLTLLDLEGNPLEERPDVSGLTCLTTLYLSTSHLRFG